MRIFYIITFMMLVMVSMNVAHADDGSIAKDSSRADDDTGIMETTENAIITFMRGIVCGASSSGCDFSAELDYLIDLYNRIYLDTGFYADELSSVSVVGSMNPGLIEYLSSESSKSDGHYPLNSTSMANLMMLVAEVRAFEEIIWMEKKEDWFSFSMKEKKKWALPEHLRNDIWSKRKTEKGARIMFMYRGRF